MKADALTHRPPSQHANLARHAERAGRFVLDRFLLVPIGATAALLWANTAGESYFVFAQLLRFPVNEIAMALFVALVTHEALEAVMPGGALHGWRQWRMPVIAAGGGAAGATFVFLAVVFWRHEQVLSTAWPVACAIDIVAGYYVLAQLRVRRVARAFLLLTAVVTDGAGVMVMALWTSLTPAHLWGAVIVLMSVAGAALLRHAHVRTFWPYLAACGSISWLGFYAADVHPALALVPIVPFLPRLPRPLTLFADPAPDSRVHRAERRWNHAVHGVLFFFALVNAGVLVRQYDTGTWAVLAAALLGRPAGMLMAIAGARVAGFRLPLGLDWPQLVVVALATSSGFTLALFFASGLLPMGAVLQQIKVGALATVGGAAAAVAVARMLGVGRFHQASGR